MPIVSCRWCSEGFYAKPNWLNIGHGKYCSIYCRGRAHRKGKVVKCRLCHKEVYKPLKDLRLSRSGKYFCGRKCALEWLSTKQFGENHASWKHGEFAYRGMLLRQGLKLFCRFCGRNDKRTLIVHHLDQNRRNNAISNLMWLCFNCHFLVHHYPSEGEKLKEKMKSHAK